MAYYDNVLLDNTNEKDHIKFSFTSTLENTPQKAKSNKTSLTGIENYIDEKYDKLTIDKLKDNIINDIKRSFVHNDASKPNDNLIDLYKEQIETLKGEIYFLREQVKEKDSWMKAFLCANIANNNDKKFNSFDHRNQVKYSIDKMMHDLDNDTIGSKFINECDNENSNEYPEYKKKESKEKKSRRIEYDDYHSSKEEANKISE